MRATREGRGGEGRAAPAEARGPGRRGHAELKARGHNAANPDDVFFQNAHTPTFGFPKMLGCYKQQK